MQLFFTKNIQGDLAYLEDQEARHCVQVLRKKEGDQVHLMDGAGGHYIGVIASVGKKVCQLQVVDKQVYKPSIAQLHLAVAPTKNIARVEWLVEKSTELGVAEISFLQCERSERKVLKMDRLDKLVITASKQSKRWYLPKLNPLMKFDKWIDQMENHTNKWIAHCSEGNRFLLSEKLKKGNSMLVLIGPEGDFTPKEVNLAQLAGFEELSLGESRLRTETAGVTVAAFFNQINNV